MHQQQPAFENIVGKEKIACIEQFLLFQQCFSIHSEICIPTMFSTQSEICIPICQYL